MKFEKYVNFSNKFLEVGVNKIIIQFKDFEPKTINYRRNCVNGKIKTFVRQSVNQLNREMDMLLGV